MQGRDDAADAARGAERRLILSYALPDRRPGLVALLALDEALGDVLRGAREPMLAQLRYTWWHAALTRLDTMAPPAIPVLAALARDVVPAVSGAALAAMVEGWEALAEGDPADPSTRAALASGRGGRLFALAAAVSGAAPAAWLAEAGRGWALADLARGLRDAAAAQAARDEARRALAPALARKWPRALRALGALAHQAAMDLALEPAPALPGATPARVARLGWHRLTGR